MKKLASLLTDYRLTDLCPPVLSGIVSLLLAKTFDIKLDTVRFNLVIIPIYSRDI